MDKYDQMQNSLEIHTIVHIKTREVMLFEKAKESSSQPGRCGFQNFHFYFYFKNGSLSTNFLYTYKPNMIIRLC